MNVVTGPFRWIAARPFARSLRFRLVMLVLLATLPSLALLFLTASQQRDEAVAAGQSETSRVARLVAADQRNVSAQIGTVVLASLTLTAELRGDNASACQARLQSLIAPGEVSGDGSSPDFRVDGASFEQAYVLGNDQSVFCMPPGQEGGVSGEDATLALTALEQGRLVTGNLRSSSTGSLLATYAVPFTRDGQQERRVLVAVVEIYALSTFGVNADLPADAFIVIFDRQGVLEQQFPKDSTSLVTGTALTGTPVVDETIGRTDPPEDTIEFRIDGREFVYAVDDFWTPGPDGGTRFSYVMVAIPEAVVVERADEQFNENLGKLVIAGLVGIVAAWVGADLMGSRDSEARKAHISDLYHAFETGEVKDLDQIIGPGYIDRTAAPGQAEGLDGVRQNIAAFRTAFQGGRIVVRELLADHDKVVARVTMTGTHVADYFGVPPSGQTVLADGVETFRFMHGMVVESWSMFGELRQRKAVADPVEAPAEERRGLLSRLFRRRPKAAPESTG